MSSSSFPVFALASLTSSHRQSSDLTQFASGSPIRIIGKGKSCSMRTWDVIAQKNSQNIFYSPSPGIDLGYFLIKVERSVNWATPLHKFQNFYTNCEPPNVFTNIKLKKLWNLFFIFFSSNFQWFWKQDHFCYLLFLVVN